MDYAGFKVASDSDLHAFARRIEERGFNVEEISAGEQPGLGRRLSFIVPTGHRIDLFSDMALSEHGPMIRNPEIWREEPHGMRVTRFDHCNLHGPNIDQVVKFFTEVLDFSPTEAAKTPDGIAAAFLSCSNKAHDVAFIRRAEPAKFHHVAFSLDSWHEVGQAADIIARYDIPLDIGRPGTASREARPSTSSIPPGTATRYSRADSSITPITRSGCGQSIRSARQSSIISGN